MTQQAHADAFPDAPPKARACLNALRALILDTARATPGAGPLTETLKWGEPAFLTEATKSGTTLRLGWKPAEPGTVRLLVHCSTTLVNDWRDRYAATLAFEGTRHPPRRRRAPPARRTRPLYRDGAHLPRPQGPPLTTGLFARRPQRSMVTVIRGVSGTVPG